MVLYEKEAMGTKIETAKREESRIVVFQEKVIHHIW